MTEEIKIKETSINEVVEINKTIREFDSYSKEYIERRYKGKDKLIIVAHVDEQPAGYLVGYDQFADGSFYCWMVGVNPDFRRKGILKALMNYQEKWARKRGYTKIKIKTANKLREMLAYLVKYGFYFTEVIQCPAVEDNKILLEKTI
jgi:GNAT superfamily N-acetyltransferase